MSQEHNQEQTVDQAETIGQATEQATSQAEETVQTPEQEQPVEQPVETVQAPAQEQPVEEAVETAQAPEPNQEQANEIAALWEALSFEGKELFTLHADGKLLLHAGQAGKERLIAEVPVEGAASVMNNLWEKYTQLRDKVTEVAAEWGATEDKVRMADKVANLKTQLTTTPALGDIDKLVAECAAWEQVVNAI